MYTSIHDIHYLKHFKEDKYINATYCYSIYNDWCDNNNEKKVNNNSFRLYLTNCNIERKKYTKGYYYLLW